MKIYRKFRPSCLTILTLLPISFFGCIKNEVSCGESLIISVTHTANEGEDLIFTIEGLDNTGIEYFLWECPDMKPYNMLSEGRVYEDDPQFIIEDFNIQDAGEYSVKMYPEGENCAAVILETTIAMNPKLCPCASLPLDNTLYYSGGYSNETMTASIYNSNTEENSQITFSGTNTFTVFFGRKLPEFSSTFNISGGNYTFWDNDLDAHLDVHFHLSAWNHGFDYFGIEDMTKSMYLERDGNILTIEFCDLEVHNYATPQFTLSGKFVIIL